MHPPAFPSNIIPQKPHLAFEFSYLPAEFSMSTKSSRILLPPVPQSLVDVAATIAPVSRFATGRGRRRLVSVSVVVPIGFGKTSDGSLRPHLV